MAQALASALPGPCLFLGPGLIWHPILVSRGICFWGPPSKKRGVHAVLQGSTLSPSFELKKQVGHYRNVEHKVPLCDKKQMCVCVYMNIIYICSYNNTIDYNKHDKHTIIEVVITTILIIIPINILIMINDSNNHDDDKCS